GARRLVNASIGKRHEHDVGLGIIGAHWPVLTAREGWADPVGLVDVGNHRGFVDPHQSLPSILATRFCSTVCFAHRNSPVAASKLQAIPVLQGIPVKVLRGPRRASGLVANMPGAFGSGLTGVLMIIISKVHSWSQLSRGKVWCRQTTSPVLGLTAQRVLVPAIVPPMVPRCASDAGPAPLDP